MIDLLRQLVKMIKILFCLIPMLSNISWAFTAYSNDELDQLEKEFKKQINLSPQVIRNPLAVNYINSLGNKLAAHGNMDKPSFFLVNSAEINAFAGPGGFIGVNSQLILASQNESELAAVMGHEMAHVRLHHLYRMIEHQKQMKIPMLASMLASIALGAINPVLGTGAMAGTMTTFQQDTINYVRSNEKEADNIGIDILTKAGFNPHGMPDFFKKMQQNMRYYYTANIPAILRTHPLDEDRIAEADNRIAQLKNIPKPTSSDNYYFFKELIRHESAHDEQSLIAFYQKDCTKFSPSYACHYGESLSLLEVNQSLKAASLLEALLQTPSLQQNPFINLALAQAYENIKRKDEANVIYQKFYHLTPNNRAVVNQYTDYLSNDDPKKALSVLLKAHRKFKNDVNICLKLARAQAKQHLLAQAYFTEATCHLIVGEKRQAMEQLKTAQKFAQSNRYMQERISAKLDELKD